MNKRIIALTLTTMILLGTTVPAMAYDGALRVPTPTMAMSKGRMKPTIKVDHKVSPASPWVYADVTLDTSTPEYKKYPIGERVAIDLGNYFFHEKGALIGHGRYCIILNNGYVVDADSVNHKNAETKQMLEKELRKNFVKGDVLFRVGFLYDDNVVERTTYWKLIDTIDLPAGSTHTLNKKYTVGATKSEQIEIGQTLGLKLGAEVISGVNVNYGVATSKIETKLTTELNKTNSQTFKDNREITSLFESNTNVSYALSERDRVILRYQLVDNYKIEKNAFENATAEILGALNKDKKEISLVPIANNQGIDVPTEKVFDVTIYKDELEKLKKGL